jgi:hypothetical protein
MDDTNVKEYDKLLKQLRSLDLTITDQGMTLRENIINNDPDYDHNIAYINKMNGLIALRNSYRAEAESHYRLMPIWGKDYVLPPNW